MSKAVQSRAAFTMLRRPKEFLREVRLELTKVKWPSLADTWNLTLVVVFTIVGVGCYVALLDVLVGWLFKLFGLYHS